MIQILKVAKELDALFREHIESIEKFKIFVRIGFNLDVYIVSKDMDKFNDVYFADFIRDTYGKQYENFRINLVVMSLQDMADNLYGRIFNDDSIDEGARHRLKSLIRKDGKKLEKQIPVITFYSYKGGMGRTTSMVSYAIHLATKKQKKVFVIDCDLEAPGYLNFFDLSQHESLKSGSVNGFVEYLCDLQFSENPNDISLQNYIINISYGNKADTADGLQNIYLMPAGNLNDGVNDDMGVNRLGYIEGLSRLNISDSRTSHRYLTILFNKIKEEINPDIILVDSRTGFNDIIGTATQFFSDVIVGFFGSNAQNMPGLTTLLDNYVKSDYKLFLVNSIVNKSEAQQMQQKLEGAIKKYLPNEQLEEAHKATPPVFRLTRNPLLEKLGIDNSDAKYIEMAKGKGNEDYLALFNVLDENLFVEDQKAIEGTTTDKTDTWTIRNRILQNLKQTLASVTSFAELAGAIKEPIFFYRNCMNELFEESKFIISGYKGTGKTYLYKALIDDSNISTRIRSRANSQRRRAKKPIIDWNFKIKSINVISIGRGNKSFEFGSLDYESISNPNLYFKRIWQIYTWNAILLDDDFASIRNQSPLKDDINEINGDASVMRYENLMKRGIEVFVQIEEDMKKINEYLRKNNIKLFLLYDQLDSRIMPRYWDKAVSPLINYWRDNWNAYSNILPKVFVRTDLFKRVMGTNTEVLQANIISIEWTIEEIFSYLMKLVMLGSAEDFWTIMERVGRSKDNPKGRYSKMVPKYRRDIPKNDNQLIFLDQPYVTPLVNTFFGSTVFSGGVNLGSPYDYFRLTLTNADRDSISLRPFINTLDKNAIEQALAILIPNRYVKAIIGSEIYATRDVRIKAANSYFDDLARDEFSQDLNNVRTFLNSEQGIEYRKKTLSEEDFAKLVEKSITLYPTNQCRNAEDMETMLRANGIVEPYYIQGQKVWRFAPMYIYAWKLSSTKYDKDFSSKAKYEKFEE